MLKPLLCALALCALAPVASAAQVSAPAAASPAILTVNSTLFDLASNPRTSVVLNKHFPGFAERLTTEQEDQERYGAITLAELRADPHFRGMNDALVAKMGAELAAAQAAPAPPAAPGA